jgi:hypothetical protein
MRARILRSLALAGLLAVGLGIAAASADAAEPIESVWSFNGGEVAVQAQPGGTLVGTVVAPTKFSECLHPVGEKAWTNVRRQPDGSYWGYHQWYFETAECVANPTLGLTAWRVLQTPTGSSFLRVCFSEPGSTSQPKIAPDGSSTGATFGCSDSALVSPVPAVKKSEAEKYILLPSNASCFGGRKLRVRLLDPAGDPFAKVLVKLRSGKLHRRAKLKRSQGRITATLNLTGLTAPKFTVKVRAETVLGRHLGAKRTYRRCGVAQGSRGHRRSA